MSILMQEAASPCFQQALTARAMLYMSAPVAAEVSLATMAHKGIAGISVVNQLIASLHIQIVDFTQQD